MRPAELGLPVPPRESCFFLDFDGTLVDFAPTPDTIEVPPELPGLLAALSGANAGAVALVTGRALPDIDRHLAPLCLPTAGLHGAVRRDAGGQCSGSGDAMNFVARTSAVREHIAHWRGAHAGLLLEDKGHALAVHFRAMPATAPVLRERQRRLLGELAALLPDDMELLLGDLVLEVRPRGADKGTAVDAFLAETPFRGRFPVYLGDDLTDLAGMAAVERHGGLAIGVGPRLQTRWQLATPTAARAWLAGCLRHGDCP